ncbi:MAG: discoidin domain-containing protein, partial [Planctomycetota bacterium]
MTQKPLAIVAAAVLCSAGEVRAKPKVVRVKVRVDSQAPGYEGARAMDGNRSTMWHTRWQSGETKHPHQITVDLGRPYEIEGIAYLPRTGAGNGTIKGYEIYVGDDPRKLGKPVAKGTLPKRDSETTLAFPAKAKGRYVRVKALSEVAGRPWTSIAELRILADGVTFRAAKSKETLDLPEALASMPEPDREFATLEHDLRNRRHWDRVASQALRPEALIHESDRDPADVVLRRTAALLAHLKTLPQAPDLAALEAELATLQSQAKSIEVADKEARRELFDRARTVRRKIAFANPLLSFDEILFIKRHRPTFNHMCDQYYGINSVPGGGLYVLCEPFGPEPTVRDVLADSVVERGRLKGQKLEGGCFVAPDLSYDAKRIAFAYVECQGDRKHRHHTDPSRGHWHPGRCYHIFKVRTDGTGLEQLTDGTWNDFDPCWLPNGRIAFISERRGGYLRCGRVCPTYTLYDMAADGSDIRCLSFHETNEWHPSVTHDGRIIYTRWDYIDRHGCTAHLPWITTLDGRDSRAVHGNFAPRRSRPDMELDCRAVPNSHKFVATAAPHHGQAFGSLVLINPRIPDDDAMLPVRRITPEVGFPESQDGAQVYATAWPLSEDYYLAVYDAGMEPGVGRQGRRHVRGSYGIYLVDSFGNKELIYRDPEIACQSPIPLRPRPMPPDRPDFVADGGGGEADEATVAVLNVYDSLKPWPQGTRVRALRVLQVIPMSVPSGGPPHETGLRLPSAGDSVNPARHVLG